MGFDINEFITPKLDYKDVALITTALNLYIEKVKKVGGPSAEEMAQHATKLINKLGNALYDCPQTEPNGH